MDKGHDFPDKNFNGLYPPRMWMTCGPTCLPSSARDTMDWSSVHLSLLEGMFGTEGAYGGILMGFLVEF